MSLTVKPWRVAAVMLTVVAVLTLLSVASLYLRFGLGYDLVLGLDLVGIFHLDSDVSVPGWYSASALLVAAAAVALRAAVGYVRRERDRRYWAGLAVVLCYLSADETARLHEQSAGILVALIEHESFLSRSWTVLAAVVVLALAALYAPFLWRLERRQGLRLVAAGGLFAFGAVGMEVLGHHVVRRRFPTDDYGVVPYQIMVHLEEIMEMGAVVLLVYAALRELEAATGSLRLDFGRGGAAPAGSGGWRRPRSQERSETGR